MRYRDAGVDVERAAPLKQSIVGAARSTWTRGVRDLPGGFAGVLDVPGGGSRLIAATLDGVGTKLHVALAQGRVGDAAQDLVRHGANDLLVHGARPFAFLDYIAQAQLDPAVVGAVVDGLARACREVDAVLLGGETAELPDTYLPGVVDVAGCMLGTVAVDRVLDGGAAAPGDVVLGLASDGLHTNGFSLARRIVEGTRHALEDPLPGGAGVSIGNALLAPHRWYGPALVPVLERSDLHALAHVTGGGIGDNLARVLPPGVRAVIRSQAWPRPALFRWLVQAGAVPEDDARQAFNLGIGMIAVCGPDRAADVERSLRDAGETVYVIGTLEAGTRGVAWQG